MQSNTRRLLLVAAFTVFFPLLTPPSRLFAASKEKVLHSFAAGQDGTGPCRRDSRCGRKLVRNNHLGGRHHERGTAFRLSRGTDGKWQERILHNFQRHRRGPAQRRPDFRCGRKLVRNNAFGPRLWWMRLRVGLPGRRHVDRNCTTQLRQGRRWSQPVWQSDLRRGWELVWHNFQRGFKWQRRNRLPVVPRKKRPVDGDCATQLHRSHGRVGTLR